MWLRLISPILRWLRRGAAVLGIALLIISFTPLLRGWTNLLSADWGDTAHAETLIVLGGETISPELLGPTSYWRSIYATLIWREGHVRRIIVSGKTVAPLMRDFLVAQGIPAAAIAVEDRSESTRDNAMFVSSMLKDFPGNRILLTSDYHSLRAARAFHKAGVDLSLYPMPDCRKRLNDYTQRWTLFFVLLKESVKFGYYDFKGWI